ncbi:unnamed protein product [Rhizoctonia solani]|uniref:Peptidase C14 caspase domain-containing protein n=1 Tax=Rhizoctonia solani TaxID=456999 RepID=A0A8H2XSD6_9AGAM|nr:unnamed protein product [Rhizoctonia solani]
MLKTISQIAEQYLDNPEFDSLRATHYDAARVYDMLRSQGYHAHDIRLLVSGVELNSQDDLEYAPTRENIFQVAGIEWLVSGTKAGDYRYFHFSGHGTSSETSFETGKVARVAPKTATIIPGSYPEPYNDIGKRTMCEIIPASELKYYTEAIVAHWIPGSDSSFEDTLIYDRELNREFSKLPRHSHLTVTLDCCHSGRMINNNYKLAGGGLRGARNFPISQLEPTRYPSVLPRVHDTPQPSNPGYSITYLESIGLELKGILMCAFFVLLKCAQLTLYALPCLIFVIRYPARVLVSSACSLMGVVLMVDKLPERERCMDGIKATVFHWSSCHQRQEAMDYGNYKGGYFTYAFCRAIEQMPSSGRTVGELYEDVERLLTTAVKEHNHKHKPSHTQHCQLWTSLGDDDELAVKNRLHLPFTL